MAITNNGAKNSQPANQIPSGYTRPTITEFTDFQYVRRFNLEIDKVTVDDATPSTTLDNIYDEAAVGINKQITDIIAAAFIATQTVTTWVDVLTITTNQENNTSTDFYNADATDYVATVILYVKSL